MEEYMSILSNPSRNSNSRVRYNRSPPPSPGLSFYKECQYVREYEASLGNEGIRARWFLGCTGSI